MSIIYNPNKKIFTLHTKNTTYQMMVDQYGYLLHLYYGAKNDGLMDYLLTYVDRGFSGNPYVAGNDRTYSLDTLPQEYPVLGVGDYRNYALNIENDNESQCCNLSFSHYEIRKGKYSLKGLPGMAISGVRSLFTDKDESGGLRDSQSGAIELTEEEDKKITSLKKNITAVMDKKTAITNVSVTLQDPKVAAVVADSVVHKLQEYIIGYRTFKAKEDCAYLEKLFKERQEEYYAAQKKYAEYVDTHDNLILQSVRAEQERLQNDMSLAYQVYSQVANQLQVARAKVQEEKPVFAVVEPAVVPQQSSGMGRKTYVIVFVFLSVVTVIGWKFFGEEFWDKLKRELV